MAGHSRREFGVLLGTAAGALFLPAGAGAAAAAGCAGSFPFVVSLTAARCSVCGRGAGVRFVTAGPISVCSECIALCLDILREEKNPRPPVEERKSSPPVNPADFVGLTRAEIAAKLRESGAFEVPAHVTRPRARLAGHSRRAGLRPSPFTLAKRPPGRAARAGSRSRAAAASGNREWDDLLLLLRDDTGSRREADRRAIGLHLQSLYRTRGQSLLRVGLTFTSGADEGRLVE